jgi:hypothetical protein
MEACVSRWGGLKVMLPPRRRKTATSPSSVRRAHFLARSQPCPVRPQARMVKNLKRIEKA